MCLRFHCIITYYNILVLLYIYCGGVFTLLKIVLSLYSVYILSTNGINLMNKAIPLRKLHFNDQ